MKTTIIDEGFIGRVYKTSAVVGLFGLLIAWGAGGVVAAVGWTAGALVSVGVLASLDRVVRRCFVPGEARAMKEFAKLSIVKLFVILAVLCLAVWIGKFSLKFLFAFCAGLMLVQAVMVLKTFGIIICERLKG